MGNVAGVADREFGWGDCDRALVSLDVNTERSVGASLDERDRNERLDGSMTSLSANLLCTAATILVHFPSMALDNYQTFCI
jgi:hypothetical protein